MKFKYIFFDVANTLLFKPNLYEVIRETLKTFDINIDIETIKSRHIIVSELIPSPPKTSKEFYKYFNSEYLFSLGISPKKDLINKIYENLKALSWQQYSDVGAIDDISLPKGIISNWDSTLTQKLNDIIKSTFTHVIFSENQGVNKPDHEIFRKAVLVSGYKNTEILFVGNSIKLDIIPATEIGMKAVLIDRDNFYPYFIGTRIDSLYKLTEVIANI
jgi:putative hydrolase of the HAD superfamily